MQHHTYGGAETSVIAEVIFQSKYYTVARAFVPVTNSNGTPKTVCAEGVARRSWKDPDDPQRGIEIATGRAKKALALKLEGKRSRHLLMNG